MKTGTSGILRMGARVPPAVWILLLVAVVFVVAGFATGREALLSSATLEGIAQRSVALGLVAIGQTFAILVASIDLSVASLISVAAVLASYLMQGDPAMIIPAVVCVLIVCAGVGLINGLIVTWLEVNPLIGTLGMGLVLQGFLSASFQNFAGSVPPSFEYLAYGRLGPFPFSVVFLLVAAIGAFVVLRHTRFGANAYAVGGSPQGARQAGIKTNRIMVTAHVVCSTMAGLTGLYLASRLRSGAPWIGRDGVYDLESIAVVVIGGTILAGGRGGVVGTLAGVLIFGTLDALFNFLGVDAYLKQVLRGGIVIIGVALYTFRSRELVA